METDFLKWAKKLKIGDTPLTRLPVENAEIFAKEEQKNLSGSVKARPALNMILGAVESGMLTAGGTIVEATSGNTGIALACIGRELGFKVVLTMPETMSPERRKILTDFGAELVLTDGKLGMKGAVEKAGEIAKKIPSAVEVLQFQNPKNTEAHRLSTACEIVLGLNGREPDFVVAGVGTGGTLMGVGGYLKSLFKNLKLIAVEPLESAVLSGEKAGPHKIEGIGAGFLPSLVNPDLIDEIEKISGEDAVRTAQKLNLEWGFSVGISSGANVLASQKLAQKVGKNKVIVTFFPDSSDRYLSRFTTSKETQLFFN